MNLRPVLRILGLVLYILALAELTPLVWCIHPADAESALGLLIGASSSAALGLGIRIAAGPVGNEGELYRREGVLVVVGSWLLASTVGAIPYLVSGAIPGLMDALFESASGFTTTGASILTDIEGVAPAILFWRGLTQWLGGIGIIVLFVALLSELGPGARFLFKLEVPGPKAEIMHAHVRETAVALFRIYLVLTAAQTLVMLVFGASLYDALVHTFATVSTGGFSPYVDSAAHFPPAIQWALVVFMLAAGVNFSLYYAIARRGDLTALRDTELRVYLALGVVATTIVVLNLTLGAMTMPVGRAIREGTFSVVSVMTTTGFGTGDFATWPGMSHAVLLALMFAGGCAGSTAGGAKIIRLLIGFKVAMREIRLTFSPNSVVVVTIGRGPVPEESLRAVMALLLLWFLGWGAGTMLLSVGDVGIVTAATASLATLSNIGPGLGGVGPTGSYAFFATWQKGVMVVLMWLGRLEFFAVLALALPHFWRR